MFGVCVFIFLLLRLLLFLIFLSPPPPVVRVCVSGDKASTSQARNKDSASREVELVCFQTCITKEKKTLIIDMRVFFFKTTFRGKNTDLSSCMGPSVVTLD